MFKQNKRYPAFDDTDPMPFGKHKGEAMADGSSTLFTLVVG